MDEMRITKSAENAVPETGVPDEEEIELISRYTRKKPDVSDIYTFTVTLCDNEVDRDCERFSVSAINEFKTMFEGVTGIFDHSMKSSDQTARVYKTQVVTDSNRMTSCSEPYTRLKAWCYMLKSEKNADLIREIDAGIKKEVSISCSVSKRICSVCGNDMRSHDCSHVQGEKINGKICHAVLTDPTDAYEWSFVAVPAQKNAGVSKTAKVRNTAITLESHDPSEIIKSLSSAEKDVILNAAQIKAVARYVASMESDADSGRECRNQAQKEIVSLAAFVLPGADTVMLGSILKKLSNDEIFMLKAAFDSKADDINAFSPEFRAETIKNFNDNSQFRI